MDTARILLVALATGALALAGCGNDDNGDGGSTGASKKPAQTGTTGSSGGGGQSVSLSETEYEITPANPSVKKTGKVTFKVRNDGQVPHALEVEGPGEEAETGTIEPGKTGTVTVDLGKAGRFEMYCPIGNHRQMGMEGEISVAGGGGASREDSGGGGGMYRSSGY
jgi:uncharacterized cupredoxin-like copper-binding protein